MQLKEIFLFIGLFYLILSSSKIFSQQIFINKAGYLSKSPKYIYLQKPADSVFNSVLKKSLKGFYFQRCGSQLLPQHAGDYQHLQCHYLTDGNFHPSADTSGHGLAFGGWHDAGDCGKYIVNAGISVGTLLMAYELFPEKFSADDLNIPESSNKIPDILDDARYELNWFLTMQRGNGALFTKLTKENFENFVMPQYDSGMRYIYEVSSTATANFAAVMARAYRVFKSFDNNFANKCLDAAKKSWAYLETHPQIFPAGGFRNPFGTVTGEYGDGDDSDERLWASAELFISTGEAKYHSYYLSNYKKNGLVNSTMSWSNLRPMAQLTYLFGTIPQIDQTIKKEHRAALIKYCSTLVQRSNNDGFNVAIVPGEYYWGSNSDVLNKAILLIAGYKLENTQAYFDTALYQLNYILGANVHNISFVTGVGDKYPMKPHHRPSASDGIIEPVPGLLVGGPNQYLNDDVLRKKFNSSTPPAKTYIDDQDSYASNEIAINWNATLVFVSGFFNGGNFVSSVETGENYHLPTDIYLEQNYSNPFNLTTTIQFSVPNVGRNSISTYKVIIKIFDLLGGEIATLVNEEKPAGRYQINWNGINNFGNKVTSGVYCFVRKNTSPLAARMNCGYETITPPSAG